MSGSVRPNTQLKALTRDGRILERAPITKVLAVRSLERVTLEEGCAGDIVAVSGLAVATVADAIVDPDVSEALPATPIDPPTIAVNFSINDSPLAGRNCDKVTSRMLRERLSREAEGNVAIRIAEKPTRRSRRRVP